MNIYMIGIGGIGMSALAQLYVAEGHRVSGSDREVSPTTELLGKKGIAVAIGQKAENVPPDAELVVYSDAVWEDNAERIKTKDLGIKEISYFEALGEVTRGRFTIAVTGTHGKTTTTALIAKISQEAGKHPTAIVGSLVPEFGSNFLAGSPDLFVVEACEYKDHVLKLSPNVLVLTNAEWDHTDWFKTEDQMFQMFRTAAQRVPEDGYVIANVRGPHMDVVLEGVKARIIDYTKEEVPELQLVGEFNKMNARAAVAAARAAFPDIPTTTIYGSVSGFKGTWRRFEIKGTTKEGALVIDDYAHHPTAIRETLKAAREKYPGKTLVVAFHPHLYSRTRDLMNEFAHAFSEANEVIIAPIYPAREEPIPGVTAHALAKKIAALGVPARGADSLEEVESFLKAQSQKLKAESLLITMGAGDIYKVADHLVI